MTFAQNQSKLSKPFIIPIFLGFAARYNLAYDVQETQLFLASLIKDGGTLRKCYLFSTSIKTFDISAYV